jgi:hypothetical protein
VTATKGKIKGLAHFNSAMAKRSTKEKKKKIQGFPHVFYIRIFLKQPK